MNIPGNFRLSNATCVALLFRQNLVRVYWGHFKCWLAIPDEGIIITEVKPLHRTEFNGKILTTHYLFEQMKTRNQLIWLAFIRASMLTFTLAVADQRFYRIFILLRWKKWIWFTAPQSCVSNLQRSFYPYSAAQSKPNMSVSAAVNKQTNIFEPPNRLDANSWDYTDQAVRILGNKQAAPPALVRWKWATTDTSQRL